MTLMIKFSRPLAHFTIFVCLLLLASLKNAFSLEMVQTTGRAVIQSADLSDSARMLALEEALYLAALKGGAKIDGYSAVKTNSEISDNFVIRPASGIIDYTITNEEVSGEHYLVTILAAVGNIETVGCKVGSKINLTTYRPYLAVTANSPSWLQSKITNVYSKVISELESTPNFSIERAEDQILDINKLNSINDNFDYTALTVGRNRVSQGNYALRVEINISNVKSFKADLLRSSSENIRMSLKSNIFQGEEYVPIFTQKDEIDVLLKQTGVSKVVNIMSRPSQSTIFSELEKLIPIHIEKIRSNLNCQPLIANLSLEDEKLVIKIGEKHGVKVSSLAVAEGVTAQWTLLRVVELGANYTILETLDKVDDLRRMDGVKINFLQEM